LQKDHRRGPASDGHIAGHEHSSELPDEFHAQHPATAPNNLTGPSVSLNKGKFEPSRNDQGAVRDDFGPSVRNIHYVAFGGRNAIQRDPAGLMSNPSNLSLLFSWFHYHGSARHLNSIVAKIVLRPLTNPMQFIIPS
jgi:hypothetical protein